jgi:tetratricopeptide (TPR) repeat protein
LNPDYADAFNSRGILLGELKQHAQALASFETALALTPDYAEALNNRGNTLRDLNRLDDALASFERALALQPDFAQAHYSRAHALRDLRRYSEAVQAYTRVVELAPDYSFAKGHLLHARMLSCEWEGVADVVASVQADIRAGRQSAEPFGYQGIADSVQDLRACAEIYAAAMFPRQRAQYSARERIRKEKIRIGYLSGEFRQQATSWRNCLNCTTSRASKFSRSTTAGTTRVKCVRD